MDISNMSTAEFVNSICPNFNRIGEVDQNVLNEIIYNRDIMLVNDLMEYKKELESIGEMEPYIEPITKVKYYPLSNKAIAAISLASTLMQDKIIALKSDLRNRKLSANNNSDNG